MITYDDFTKVDIRVGTVIKAEPFPEASMAALVLHIHREVIHHGAEISLLRDLYQWTDGQPPS